MPSAFVNVWFASDHHFGHSNIIKFTDNDGALIRPFSSIDEHDETIISKHNELVKPNDRVYIMGDVAINRKNMPLVGRLNGKKILIKGNHDIFKLDDYTPYFEDIRSYKVMPKHSLIVSHIPIHSQQLEHRFKYNVHGHLHSNIVERQGSYGSYNVPDFRYMSLCLEKTGFKPLSLDQVLSHLNYDVKE